LIALLPITIAPAINLRRLPGSSGRGSADSARAQTLTLTNPSTPTKIPDEEGFIRWRLVLEPIVANGLADSAVEVAVRKEYFPNQLTVIPHDGDKIRVEGSELL
jgi:hypothetical protein